MKNITYVILLILLTIPTTLLASENKLELGDIIKEEKLIVNKDINYSNISLITNNNRNQQILTAKFNINSENTEMVLHDKMPGYATVLDIAKDYEAKTGRKVYAAVNADFFWANLPIDHYVKNSEVVHLGLGNEQSVNFGFNSSGEYAIGKVPAKTDLGIRITHENGYISTFKIDGLGGIPHNNKLFVYPEGSRVIVKDSTKYLIKVDSEYEADHVSSYISGKIERTEDLLIQTDIPLDVPKGYLGLSYNSDDINNYMLNFLFQELKNDTKIEIINTPSGDFENMEWGVGAKNILVQNNIVMPEPFKDGSSGLGNHPRTTLGITNDNEFFIQVIDGRQSGYSVGVTTKEQAELARDFNAKAAVELDGGGSSQFVLRVDGELKVVNKPSQIPDRPVINAVLFTDKINKPNLNWDDIEEPDDDGLIKKNNLLKIIMFSVGAVMTFGVLVYMIKKLINK